MDSVRIFLRSFRGSLGWTGIYVRTKWFGTLKLEPLRDIPVEDSCVRRWCDEGVTTIFVSCKYLCPWTVTPVFGRVFSCTSCVTGKSPVLQQFAWRGPMSVAFPLPSSSHRPGTRALSTLRPPFSETRVDPSRNTSFVLKSSTFLLTSSVELPYPTPS